MSIKTTFIDIAKRIIGFDKKLSIQQNGADNLYTERMEAYRNNSVTASMASIVMTQYIVGKGFEGFNNVKIGKERLIDITNDLAESIVNNRGAFIHVNYNANLDISDFSVLPFSYCRLGEKDSKDYNGKILVSKDWSSNPKEEDLSVVDVFNENKSVTLAQVNKCKGDTIEEKIGNYKGQILFFNMDRKYFYPLSRINPVFNDCDSEAQASIYKNELLRRGFFGKTLVVTRPLIDEGFYDDKSDEGIRVLREAESERENFKSTIKDFIGAEGAGGALHLELDYAGDKLDEGIMFKNIESNIDDKLFEFTENSVLGNILMAYNNLPIALVKSPDSALLGNSGDALNVAKLTYSENTTTERQIVESLINLLVSKMDNEQVNNLKIKPLISTEVGESEAESEKRKAQATLRGSVGGVTSLLAMQQSVSEGITDLAAAIEIVKEIYGIEEDTARKMLGTPKIQENDTDKVS